MRLINDIEQKISVINSWNNTYRKKAITLFPQNLKEIRIIFNKLKYEKKNFLIKTGACSYDSKSINSDQKSILISLKKFNKVNKVNKKNNYVEVEAGVMICDLIKYLKSKKLTLYSVPGGEKISIGGAISANVIGKDSSKNVSCFGDTIRYLEILDESGKIKIIRNNSGELNKYIGAFGLSGLIIRAGIKVKNIPSSNLKVNTKILNSLKEIQFELNHKADYKYVQIDPFFRSNNFAIVFTANSIRNLKNNFRNVNFKANYLEKLFFKFSSFFINKITWRIFYKIFFIKNNNKEYVQDIHNYHYSSKYKHMVPQMCKGGLIDYELMIRNNFIENMKLIIFFLQKNNLYPIYIVVKKIYKSDKKFFYQFNQDGYAVAISFIKNKLDKNKKKLFLKLIKKKKLELNLSKSDEILVKKIDNKNKLFLSMYKKMVVQKYGLRR
tara:strand:- start:174 stop:1490 length:1317 start_codon:yes stop_codon:yes gene_type:complete